VPEKLHRNTKLNPEVIRRMVESLSQCGLITVAAQAAGVTRFSVLRWMDQGETEEDPDSIHRQLYLAVTAARTKYITEAARVHRRWSIGGIIERPRVNDDGEIMVDDNGEPVIVKVFQPPDLKAIQWELTRLWPLEYKSPDVSRVDVQQNVEVRPSLLDVLERIGPIPDDTPEDVAAARALLEGPEPEPDELNEKTLAQSK
jgi:hypothetical protein